MVVRDPRQHEEPVQPRRAVGAAGRLDLQGVRARRRDREGRRTRTRPTTPRRRSRARAGRGARTTTRPASPWQVTTYGHDYAGSISVTSATLRSDNTVYAQLTLDVGPDYVWRMAKRLGINLTQKPVASIGLGPLSRLAARDGRRLRDVRLRRHLREADGDQEGRAAERQGRQVRRLGQAAGEARAVGGRGVEGQPGARRERALRHGLRLARRRPPGAGKTGTTEDHADAWYVGYTRDFSTAVWMGYPNGEIPMLNVHGQAVAGATFPVPIWHAYMAAAEWRKPARDVPRAQPRGRLPAAREALLRLHAVHPDLHADHDDHRRPRRRRPRRRRLRRRRPSRRRSPSRTSRARRRRRLPRRPRRSRPSETRGLN